MFNNFAILNTKQSRSLTLTGNVYDLFSNGVDYVPLIDCLSKRLAVETSETKRGLAVITWSINKPIKISAFAKDEIAAEWDKTNKYMSVVNNVTKELQFEDMCSFAASHPTQAIIFLKGLTSILRRNPSRNYDLMIVIDSADLLFPQGEISRLSEDDRARVSHIYEWITDSEFMNGSDSLILISESKSLINERLTKLPQLVSVDVERPDLATRQSYLEHIKYNNAVPLEKLAKDTGGLTLHALRQLTCERNLTSELIVKKIEEFFISQLDDTVEFYKPDWGFKDAVGFTSAKQYMLEEMIPRILTSNKKIALSGAVFGGPIGGGKSFLGGCLASKLDCPVLVLKNIRSQWYGQTDAKFDRLVLVLKALDKVVVFVDEADTFFGDLTSSQTHETEKRLTGKMQAVMSDPDLKGKVFWLLMTARIHLLSADIRRQGRAGDLVIPILDPEDDDRKAFIKWALDGFYDESKVGVLEHLTQGYSAAAFALLKSEIAAKKEFGKCKSVEDVVAIADDLMSADIGLVREAQILQAKLNCTRKSLLSQKDTINLAENQKQWRARLSKLADMGVK